MSNNEAEIKALNKLLHDAHAELEASTEERERRALERYGEYLEARLARFKASLNPR